LRNLEVATAEDLLPPELVWLLLPATLTLAVGVYPLPILELFRLTAEASVAALSGL
jgi:NADH:ubiquinone oxidoreductase subunit 4 (subunit M)